MARDQLENEILLYPRLFPHSQKKNRQTATTMRWVIHIALCHSSLNLARDTLPIITTSLDRIFSLQRKSFVTIAKAPTSVRRRVGEECITRSLEIIGEQGQTTREQKKRFDEIATSLLSLSASISANPLQCLALPTVFLDNPDGVIDDLTTQEMTRSMIDSLITEDLGAALELFCTTNPDQSQNNNNQQNNQQPNDNSPPQHTPSDQQSRPDQSWSPQEPRDQGAQGDGQWQWQTQSSQGEQSNQHTTTSSDTPWGEQPNNHPLRGIFADRGEQNNQQTQGQSLWQNNLSQWQQQLDDIIQTPPSLNDNDHAWWLTEEQQGFPDQWEGYVDNIRRLQTERQHEVDMRLRNQNYGPYDEILNTFETFFGDTEAFRERSRMRQHDDRSIFNEWSFQ